MDLINFQGYCHIFGLLPYFLQPNLDSHVVHNAIVIVNGQFKFYQTTISIHTSTQPNQFNQFRISILPII